MEQEWNRHILIVYYLLDIQWPAMLLLWTKSFLRMQHSWQDSNPCHMSETSWKKGTNFVHATEISVAVEGSSLTCNFLLHYRVNCIALQEIKSKDFHTQPSTHWTTISFKCDIPESSGEGCLCSWANSSGLFSTQFHIAWKKQKQNVV